MFNFKYCPFCDGHIKFESRMEWIDSVKTEVSCVKCGMNFTYEQYFSYSKDGRIAMNNSFEDIWNNRVSNT